MLRRCSLAIALCLAAPSVSAQVVGFTNTTGIVNPRTVIHFDEVPTAPWKTTNEYAAYGVTFSPYVYQFPGTMAFWDHGIHGDWVQELTIRFTSPVYAAALQMTGNPLSLTAYLGNTAVASQLFGGSKHWTDWEYVGFQALSGSFDRITVSMGQNLSWTDFDNLQLTVTPEPATNALLALGMLAMGVVAKLNFRRKKLK